jgi:integrase
MKKYTHELTVRAIETAKPKDKDYKLADGRGLFLLVTAKGQKYWRFKYYEKVGDERVEKRGSLGVYPQMSLKEAREAHARFLETGVSPAEAKRTEAVERSKNRPFSEIAQEWLEKSVERKGYAKTSYDRKHRTARYMCEAFGNVPITEVSKSHLTKLLTKIDDEGKHSKVHITRTDARELMEWAHGRGYVETDPFAGCRGKGFDRPPTKARPAIIDPVAFGQLMRDIDAMPDRVSRKGIAARAAKRIKTEEVATALRLLAMFALRPCELMSAEWRNVDWEACKLTIPAEVLKQKKQREGTSAAGRALEVPLSRQAIAELRALHCRTGGHARLFPTAREYSLVCAMRDDAGYRNIHVPHGFRSSFSTMMNKERRIIEGEEVLRWPDQSALIELQLDHNDSSVQTIYNRAGGRWRERSAMMQRWSDKIDEMRTTGVQELQLAA